MKCKKMLDVEELKKLFYYDDETGVLYHKVNKRKVRKGDSVGYLRKEGYLTTTIQGSIYCVHRVIWALWYGSIAQNLEIDHISGNKLDNKLNNLRLVTAQTNAKNIKIGRSNTSGHLGVCFNKGTQKWGVHISPTKGKRMRIECIETKKEAIIIRKQAEKEYGYHKNHGRSANE